MDNAGKSARILAISYDPLLAAGCIMLSPRTQPLSGRAQQRLTDTHVRDPLDRLADEGLDQQSLSFFFRNTTRHQVELQRAVDGTGRRAMAALHVVGEDLEFRLVVRFRLVGEQKRMARHFGVGLLGVRLDNDLALENAVALILENGTEALPAGAATRGMTDNEGIVDVLTSFQQRRPANRSLGSLAFKARKNLIAYDGAASRVNEAIVGRPGPDRQAQRGNAQRSVPVIADHDMIDMRAITDHQLKG